MFKTAVIAKGVKSDFGDVAIAGFAKNAARVAYGTAGFRTIGSALPPVAYRCVFVVFCRSLAARLSTSTANPLDAHHFVINPSTIGDCGMMITASHNPAQDNGLKIVDPDGGMFVMDWENDATEVANLRTAEQFAEGLVTFAKAHLVMGATAATSTHAGSSHHGSNDDAEHSLWQLLRDRPVRIHVGRDTRQSGDAIWSSIMAAAKTLNAMFAPIALRDTAGGSYNANTTTVIEIIDHGILTTPTLHAMVYWNRHHHELPVVELGLADPSLHKTFDAAGASSTEAFSISNTAKLTGVTDASVSSSNHSHGALLSSRHHDVEDNVSAAARRSLANALTMPISKSFNERLVFRSFVTLWEELGCATTNNKRVVIDCSNGVGTVIMRESLDLPVVLLPDDRAFLAAAAAHNTNKSNPLSGAEEYATTVGTLVKAITGIEFSLVHTDIADHTLLNKDCGADHTQKTRVPSSVFTVELAQFVKANADAIVGDTKTFLSSHSHSITGASGVAVSPADAFCTVVGKRIAFYCFDGDADRVVAFAPCPCPRMSTTLTADSSVDDFLAATIFELLDGDRIAVLLSSLVRDSLKRTSAGYGSNANTTAGTSTVAAPKIGVVQTAYANGASTNYIMSKLHIPVVCAATGVKYLHPKAEAMEVGIYFEANGHGTALSSAALYGTTVTLEGTTTTSKSRSRSASLNQAPSVLGAGTVIPPGVAAKANATGSNPSTPNKGAAAAGPNATPTPAPLTDEELAATYHANDRTIVPYLWFGNTSASRAGGHHGSAPPAPHQHQGLKNLLLLRYLLSQCCGDAIADMLACELSLAALDWTAFYWQTMYSDLPSITGKTMVRDPSVIKNTPDQRHATHPIGLQSRIDAIVEAMGGPKTLARSFVRPSGTEPIVRVYAEATTKEVTQELFSRVAEAVGEMCN